ncbi:PQQ-dependent catabolism-associated beta-propeller protein [Cognatilysobacter terrigena]|uniref:PQQ-dependent catabolism-associated beta-propeller protein n=1 Tax=Cognatilysobacter terrigena TaxID=2488749 RepID=UPI001AAD652A|nr:PQQ-dependent catabolism-associated beta-propeller protein [Lysobacter terrigena]
MRTLMRRAFAAGLALSPALALAHGDAAARLAAPRWTFDAAVTVPLAVSLVWYLVGLVRLASRSATTATWRGGAAWYLSGWVVLAGAIVSPLHAAGERSFAAHMLEHELLMLVAAPLLVMSRPLGVMLWALPWSWRVALAATGKTSAVSGAWRFLTAPVAASLVQMAALWGWHAPPAFDRALANSGWHIAQHVSFLVTALLVWWAMLHSPRTQRGLVVGCLFFTATASGALGALMAFSHSPWYAGYAALRLDAFGLSPTEDQQLAGLLMWVPGGLVHAAAGIALLARGLVDVPSRTVGSVGLALLAVLVAPLARAETVYVSDEQANVVHVIHASNWTHNTIATGRRPRGLEMSRDGRRLLIAAGDDDRIDVIDLAAKRVVDHLPSGADPERFALSPDGKRLYVANEADSKVSAVDIPGKRIVAEVGVGAEPEGMAVSPDGRWVIATSETASLVHFIDAATMKLVDSRMVGTRPRDALFTPDGRGLWVTSETRATATLFDMRTRTPSKVVDFDRDPGANDTVQAVGLALSPSTSRLYVALGRGDRVGEVDTASGRILRYLPAGHRVWGIALSRDGKRLYTANGLSGDVGVVDLASGRTITTIHPGGKPWGVAVGP